MIKLGVITLKGLIIGFVNFTNIFIKKKLESSLWKDVHRGSADKRPHNHSHYIIKNKNPDWHNLENFIF